MNNTIKDFQPAIHRKLIAEGKLLPQESERIVREWKLRNQIEKTTGETTEDMGIGEEMGEWLQMHGFPGERGWEI